MILMALAAVAIAVVVLMLTFAIVKKWFRSNNTIQDKEHVNVVLKQRLKSGKYKTVGGIFNPKTEKVLNATAWESKELDEDLQALDRVAVLHDVSDD